MKQMIDEKGRLFGKLSVIDAAVILIVIAVAFGAFLKFVVLEQTAVSAEVHPVSITLEVSGVRAWGMNNIRAGDTIFTGGTEVGEITEVEVRPFRVYTQGEGQVWWGEVPDRYVLILSVAAEATISEEGRVMVSRVLPMNIGNSGVGFVSRYADFVAAIREISINE